MRTQADAAARETSREAMRCASSSPLSRRKADEIRKKIVATKEGGAITGEERLREHTDTLYGAIMSYDGKPTDYQLARIDALNRELGDVKQQFAKLREGDLAKTNAACARRICRRSPCPTPRRQPPARRRQARRR